MFNQSDLDPIESGDLLNEIEIVPLPRGQRTVTTRRCGPEVRQFMRNALRELERKSALDAALAKNAGETPNESIEVSLKSFERIGLGNKYQVVSALDSCPEAEYIKVEPINDTSIKLTKIGEPETKPVKHYTPRRFGQDEETDE